MSDAVKVPYNLHPTFEAVLLYRLSSDVKLWHQIGHAIEKECFAHPQAHLIYECVRLIVKDGQSPSPLTVLQRIHTLIDQGKVTPDDSNAVNALFDGVADLPHIPEGEAVLNEILPLLKRRMQGSAIQLSHTQWAKGGDFDTVMQALTAADRLGVSTELDTLVVGASSIQRIDDASKVATLPTGIFELDQEIGGLWVGALGLWMARAGGGKSMALINQLSYAMRHRVFGGFITLELPMHMQLARLSANLINLPINSIMNDPTARREAESRLKQISHLLGPSVIVDFPSYNSTVVDIDNWIEEQEQKQGGKMMLLCVDYADRLIDPRVRDNNDYIMMRYVYNDLRDLAVKRSMFIWTATQAKRGKTNPRSDQVQLATLDDAADSMHKPRIADMVISSNIDEDTTTFYVGKHRMSRDSYPVGPIMTDFANARIHAWTTELGPW